MEVDESRRMAFPCEIFRRLGICIFHAIILPPGRSLPNCETEQSIRSGQTVLSAAGGGVEL